jgi:hypothetical protein
MDKTTLNNLRKDLAYAHIDMGCLWDLDTATDPEAILAAYKECLTGPLPKYPGPSARFLGYVELKQTKNLWRPVIQEIGAFWVSQLIQKGKVQTLLLPKSLTGPLKTAIPESEKNEALVVDVPLEFKKGIESQCVKVILSKGRDAGYKLSLGKYVDFLKR